MRARVCVEREREISALWISEYGLKCDSYKSLSFLAQRISNTYAYTNITCSCSRIHSIWLRLCVRVWMSECDTWNAVAVQTDKCQLNMMWLFAVVRAQIWSHHRGDQGRGRSVSSTIGRKKNAMDTHMHTCSTWKRNTSQKLNAKQQLPQQPPPPHSSSSRSQICMANMHSDLSHAFCFLFFCVSFASISHVLGYFMSYLILFIYLLADWLPECFFFALFFLYSTIDMHFLWF